MQGASAGTTTYFMQFMPTPDRTTPVRGRGTHARKRETSFRGTGRLVVSGRTDAARLSTSSVPSNAISSGSSNATLIP
ncbi:hypothetical protein S83_039411 [Arachis hypogaea]